MSPQNKVLTSLAVGHWAWRGRRAQTQGSRLEGAGGTWQDPGLQARHQREHDGVTGLGGQV